MATQQDPLPLAERTDVHKSCKSLETLLGVLNDYCEATNAIAVLQRKLAKALRDTAGVKITGEFPSNAMNTAAIIFETLAEVDAKFAKIADREYDSLSAEVKKWFKKLAKEEKAHDERLANANAKIKQAGQLYEKKMKKNPREAVDEHARYINLISNVGPEISQDKYNHALFVTQRHTATTFSTAACLARIADAEWLRTCESVRRFSPSIGPLSEWRTYCEGGWQGAIPQDLPDLEAHHNAMSNLAPPSNDRTPDFETKRSVSFQYPDEREQLDQGRPSAPTTPAEQDLPSRYPTARGTVPERPRLESLARNTGDTGSYQELVPPRMPAASQGNFESVRTLSAFPLPPDYFPIPPPRTQQGSFSQSSQSSQPRMTESPLPDGETSSPEISRMVPNQVPAQDVDSSANSSRLPHLNEESQTTSPPSALKAPEPKESISTSAKTSPIIPPAPPPQISEGPRSRSPENSFRDHNDREFGLKNGSVIKAKTIDVASTNVDRSENAATTGSLVAAMRHRYTNSSGAISPTKEREPPRLPKSVNELAARYQTSEEPGGSRMRSPSASSNKPLPQPQRTSTLPAEAAPSQPERRNSYESRAETSGSNAGSESPQLERRPPPQDERQTQLAEIERKEYELRQRERELEYRSRELESERARLQNVPEGDEAGAFAQQYNHHPQAQPQRRTRERKTSFKLFGQHPPSPRDQERSSPVTNTSPNRPYHAVQHSYSASHLAPPTASQHSDSYDRQSQQSYNPRLSNASQQSIQGHAPFCGCEACSVSKYKESSGSSPTVPYTPAPPPQLRPIPEKKTSWVKRLSMPVGSALGLDSKKGAGVVHIPGNGMSLDGKKITNAGLYDRAQIDGRRSYDPNAIGNRSMTNLGVSAGRR